MAEGILFDLAGKVLEGLVSLAAEELGAAWGLKEEIDKLHRTASTIRAVLRDAEDQRNRNNHQVTHWLENLKDVIYDMEDLLDEFYYDALRQKIVAGDRKAKKVRLFFSTSNQLAYGLKMAPKVKAIRERLDAISADKANFQLSDCPVETPIVVRERDQTYSFEHFEEIIGRDDDKNKIVQLLLESEPKQNVSIVPIIGIGGLGKTTLAKMVFNDERLKGHFELKMWVCVSDKFELKVIVEKVIEAATTTKPKRKLQLETLQHHLRESIDRKKYLLVLDDVWNDDPEKWRNLRNLLSGGARGSWIVITTRSGLVAEITGTVPHHNLQGLSRSESWSLLKQTAFKEESRESNNSRIEAIGMEIVDKCKGVPLALRAIGKVLYKRTEAEWVKVNKNVHKYLTHEENGIMPILKLSYHHLPSHLKQCFAYCSLVRKGTSFSVPDLIHHWMALGFIQPLSEDEDLEETGYEYFKDLVWRSFLECRSMDCLGESRFTIHDLMHDLACSVAGKEYCIVGLEAENVNKRSRHVSFDSQDSPWEMGNTLLKATKVRSFVGNEYWCVNPSLTCNFKCLRVLIFYGSYLKMLRHSIGNLKHLRALYIVSNSNIRELPSSLLRLQLLETLNLDGCGELDCMPCGLGKLISLQNLPRFVVGRTTGKNVGGLSELNGLKKLKGKLHILDLQNTIVEKGSTYLKDKLNLKSLVLEWRWRCREGETVLECLQPRPNLEKLQVIGYPGNKMSSWLSSVTNLSELILEGFANCQHLPPLRQLYSLKVIRLSRLEALENVSETEMQEELVSGKSTTILFPSLEELEINDCPNLKGWWKGDVGEASNPHLPCFPCLTHLTIKYCPNLTTMPLFPSVTELKLKCTSSKPFQETMKLKKINIEAPSSSTLHPLSKLRILNIQGIQDLYSLQEEFQQNLTSLQSLQIRECFSLTSLPEGMCHLTSLIYLEIIDCPQLSKRFQWDTDLDWPNIAHIERIWIVDGYIVKIRKGF